MRLAWRRQSHRHPEGSGSRSRRCVQVSAAPERERVPRPTRPGRAPLSPGVATRSAPPAMARVARRVEVEGVVQGVGFRPFVYRLAAELGLDGVVWNAAGRVVIVAAGSERDLDRLAERLESDAPPRARVERVVVRELVDGERTPVPGVGFSIEESVASASSVRLFPPDIATCDDCLRELFDPLDRRYRYPFINCTNCGPRATIIDQLPYDRTQTTLRDFRP